MIPRSAVGIALLATHTWATVAAAQTPQVVHSMRQPSSLLDTATVRPVSVEQPEALWEFGRALRDLQRGRRQRVLVAHYGDSNVAASVWTEATRQRLQAVFGDAGPGFLTVGAYGTYPRNVPWLRTSGFEGRRYSSHNRFGPLDGLWGLAGVAGEGMGTNATLHTTIEVGAQPTELEIHALGWPRGGSFLIQVDGATVAAADTAQPTPGVIRRSVRLGPGSHRVLVRVTSWRPVRILGAVLENQRRGVVYDTLGINGQRMGAVHEWNRDLWADHLRGRTPNLVILGYGGNEALDEGLSMERYRQQLERSLARVRALMPEASCLVVTPVAMCGRPRNAEVNAIQRWVAPRYGCALWDASQVSGGPDSLCGWIRAGLVGGDRLHLNEEGYRRIGDAMGAALLEAVQPRR